MEGDESKSKSSVGDNLISHDVSFPEAVEGFQRSVNVVLEAIDEDENFSELTAEKYSRKRSCLIEHLAELSRVHRVLVDHHVHLFREFSRKCPSLITNQHLHPSDSISPELKRVIEENESDIKTRNTDLQTEKAMVIELQKQVDELTLVLSDSNIKITTMEDELETSRKELAAEKEEISNLKGVQCRNLFQENQKLKDKIQSYKQILELTHKKIDIKAENYQLLQQQNQITLFELARRDKTVEELNKKIDQCMSQIAQMEGSLKLKEETQVGKLKDEINTKCMSLEDLKKKFNDLKLEKKKISDRVASLRADKCYQDRLTEELKTGLKSLKSEHRGVISLFDSAQEVGKELKLKIVELEREVDRQMKVISDITEEKLEVIRQLCSSLEHYMSRCKEVSQLLAANKVSCFDWLH